MSMFDFQNIAQLAAARGLNTLIEGVALAAFSWCALQCFGRRSAMTRFAVWFATLLMIAVLPFVSLGGASVSAYDPAPELTLSGSWGAAFFVVWAVVASVLLARIAVSLLKIARLRRNCVEIHDHPRVPQLEPVTQRRAKLLVSDEIRVPTALGFFKPAVVLPRWALEQLSGDELKAIVLHELAHLRRRDNWTNLAQKLITALFFFHPAVWWIDGRLALEREMACDDLVLDQTNNARTYAASLVSVAEKIVAEKMRMGRALALAQNAVGRMREVSLRLTKILDAKRAARSRGLASATAMVGTLAVIAIVATPYAPEVISFQAKAQPATLAAKTDARPVTVRPASLRWVPQNDGPQTRIAIRRSNLRPRSNTLTREGPASSWANDSFVVPAKARIHKADRRAKVVMTRGTATPSAEQNFLVLHTSAMDPYGAVWTLSVWHYTSADGSHVVQETIVMSSI